MKRYNIFIFTLVFLLSFPGCMGVKKKQAMEKTGFYFDTVIKITVYDAADEELLDDCFRLCGKYEQLLSRTVRASDIYKINHAGGKPVEVSPETAGLIEKALFYSRLSDGAFDITTAPLSDLWNFKETHKALPDEHALKEALSHVGYENIIVNDNTVTLKDPKSAIDLGAIAKGYIADKLKEYLEDEGIEHALINLGGNVLAVGEKPDGTDYTIGIQKPFDERNSAITTVSIKDRSVVSSGVYERYFELDGKRYHHILNPKTGYPYENGLLGVTIISDSSADGDALSTTCFALGLEKGMELIKSLDHAEAIFITDDYQLHYTDRNKK